MPAVPDFGCLFFFFSPIHKLNVRWGGDNLRTSEIQLLFHLAPALLREQLPTVRFLRLLALNRKADCSWDRPVCRRSKPRTAFPGTRSEGGCRLERGPREPGPLCAPASPAEAGAASAASGAQNPGWKASAALPDASAEHMLHSSNSFLIHDISVGTIGASKQPLSKPKQPHDASEKSQPLGPERFLLCPQGMGVWKTTF